MTTTPTPPTSWSDPGPVAVADGIYRIPLPLPTDALKAVNVYAIEDGDDLVLIDAGWVMTESRDALEKGLGQLNHDLGQVTRFLVTHAHRDHYTLGVALRREFGTKVALGLGEQPTLEKLTDPTHNVREAQTARMKVCRAAPLIEGLWALPHVDHDYKQWEFPDEWLTDRQVIDLSTRTLEVVATPGHTIGHVVFVDRDNRLMFSGDHVLPHITPSIGLEPNNKQLPLVSYLQSLALMTELPDLRMLPAHGDVRDSVHARVGELQQHHEIRLRQTLAAVRDGATSAYAVARVLPWTRRERTLDSLDLFNQIMATTETLAHLDVLAERGELTKTTQPDGAFLFEPLD
jgi:glyoxylase-like metal-dependent hydrolase (beta-lactamase superfamily II)